MTTEIEVRNAVDYDLASIPDQKFNRLIQLAQMMNQPSATVPSAISDSLPDCMAVVVQSDVWGLNPFQVVQKCHVIKGKIGYEAQLINAVGNKFAPLKEGLREEYIGDWNKIAHKTQKVQSDKNPGSYAVRAWTNADEDGLGIIVRGHLKGENEPRELKVMLNQCATRNSTLWATMPQQQLYYFATKMWYRRYCPQAIMGMYSPDELETIEVDGGDATPVDEPKELMSDHAIASLRKLMDSKDIPADMLKVIEEDIDNGIAVEKGRELYRKVQKLADKVQEAPAEEKPQEHPFQGLIDRIVDAGRQREGEDFDSSEWAYNTNENARSVKDLTEAELKQLLEQLQA